MRLTRDEILLIASVLGALLVGAVVKHARDQSRARQMSPAPAAQTQR